MMREVKKQIGFKTSTFRLRLMSFCLGMVSTGVLHGSMARYLIIQLVRVGQEGHKARAYLFTATSPSAIVAAVAGESWLSLSPEFGDVVFNFQSHLEESSHAFEVRSNLLMSLANAVL